MKNIFIILAFTALFASCNKDKEVEISYQLTANITAIDVVKNLKDIDNSDLFPNGAVSDGEKVRISVFIYNKAGELVIEETKLMNSFAEILTINKPIKEGEYTIVSCADVVDADNLTTISKGYWRIDNKESQQNCKAKFTSDIFWPTLVLGYSKQTISVSKTETTSLNLKPTGSLVILNFINVDLSNIQTIKIGITTWNDYFSLFDGTFSVMELLNGGNTFTFNKLNTNSSNIIRGSYFLPTNQLNIKWVGLNAVGNQIKSGTIPSSALVAAQNKLITINSSTGIATITIKSAPIEQLNSKAISTLKMIVK